MPCASSWLVLGSARTELTTLCEWLPLQRKEGGTTLTIAASYRTDDMVRIALAGKGHITFDDKDAQYIPRR